MPAKCMIISQKWKSKQGYLHVLILKTVLPCVSLLIGDCVLFTSSAVELTVITVGNLVVDSSMKSEQSEGQYHRRKTCL